MHSQASHHGHERIIIESTLGHGAAHLCLGAIAHRAHAANNPLVAQTRGELGLPPDSLLFMTGHQAELWHPGILAKYIASSTLAKFAKDSSTASTLSSISAHVVVDQDNNDGDVLRVPLTPVGRHSVSLSREPGGFANDSANGRDRTERVAMKLRQPLTSGPLRAFLTESSNQLSPHVHASLTHLSSLIESTSTQPNVASNAATHWARILSLAASPVTHLGPVVFATSISQTSGFKWLLKQLQANPQEAIIAYNQAAARFPRARIAALHVSPTHPELTQLPLWHIDPVSGLRRTVTVSQLATLPLNEVAPKALMLTAFLRLFVCDLFIHGLGGGQYDLITDAWIGSFKQPSTWLPIVQMAPTATVTATLYLPFDVEPPPTPDQLAQAARNVHRAQHDPNVVSADAMTLSAYGQLIQASQGARSKTEKRAAYTALHDFLKAYRNQYATAISQLKETESELARKSKTSSIVYDRTWPFIFYSQAQLESLKNGIESRLASG